jgi:hypothetical protein
MPEDRNDERLQHLMGRGHRLQSPIVRRDFYHLLTAFLASKHLIGLSDGQDHCPFWRVRDEFEESEIVRLLVTTAVGARIREEDLRAFEKARGLQLPKSPPVGTLVRNIARPTQEEPLHLREACNKIIHAELINFDRVNAKKPTKSYLNPKVYLYSSRDRKSGWRAVLHVAEYAGVGLSLVGE